MRRSDAPAVRERSGRRHSVWCGSLPRSSQPRIGGVVGKKGRSPWGVCEAGRLALLDAVKRALDGTNTFDASTRDVVMANEQTTNLAGVTGPVAFTANGDPQNQLLTLSGAGEQLGAAPLRADAARIKSGARMNPEGTAAPGHGQSVLASLQDYESHSAGVPRRPGS